MIGRNFIVKHAEIFSEHNAKNFAWNSFPLTEKWSKKEMIQLSYDVNDQVYSKLKPIQLRTDLANIEVRLILT